MFGRGVNLASTPSGPRVDPRSHTASPHPEWLSPACGLNPPAGLLRLQGERVLAVKDTVTERPPVASSMC